MATIWASAPSLMADDIKPQLPVAGVAISLVPNGDNHVVISDIANKKATTATWTCTLPLPKQPI